MYIHKISSLGFLSVIYLLSYPQGQGQCRRTETTCKKSDTAIYCCGKNNFYECCANDDSCCPYGHKCCGQYCCKRGDECRSDGCYTYTTTTYYIPIGLICAGIGAVARCMCGAGDKSTEASPGQELREQNREDGDIATHDVNREV